MKFDAEDLLYYYEQMLLIRIFEESILELFKKGKLKGTTHLYCGQEAIAVGVCSQLSKDDYVVSTHRGHGHCIGKGGSPKRLMSEIFGKEEGYCGGRGGSQNIIDLSIGFLGANGITGGGMPIALGAAFQQKYRDKQSVTVAFIGDGATNQGAFHETLNMASIWDLPLIVVCENNQYAMYTPIKDTVKDGNIVIRAQAYKIKGFKVDGNDIREVIETMIKAKKIVLEGKRPVLIEAITYRKYGHSKSDKCIYRTREEEKEWEKKCPIALLKKILEKDLAEEQLKAVEKRAKKTVDDAITFAEKSPIPYLDNKLENYYCYKTLFPN